MEIVVKPVQWSPEVRDALAPAFSHDTTGGLIGTADFEAMGGVPFQVERDGAAICHYVLSTRKWSGGAEGYILCAAGAAPGGGPLGAGDLPAKLLPVIEQQFLDVRAITVHTKRIGLARKLGRAGYVIDGYILRKHVTKGHA